MDVVHLGSVDIIPGRIDTARLLESCGSAMQGLADFISVLRAAAAAPEAPPPTDPEAILAGGKTRRPRLTATHPTIQKLDQVLKARQNAPNDNLIEGRHPRGTVAGAPSRSRATA
jgi:hypothetical protein